MFSIHVDRYYYYIKMNKTHCVSILKIMMKTKCRSVTGLTIIEWWKVDEDQDWFYDLPNAENPFFFSQFFTDGDKEERQGKLYAPLSKWGP